MHSSTSAMGFTVFFVGVRPCTNLSCVRLNLDDVSTALEAGSSHTLLAFLFVPFLLSFSFSFSNHALSFFCSFSLVLLLASSSFSSFFISDNLHLLLDFVFVTLSKLENSDTSESTITESFNAWKRVTLQVG